MVSASVGVDSRTMHGHDVAVDKYSGYNLIARKTFATRVRAVHRQGKQNTEPCCSQ